MYYRRFTQRDMLSVVYSCTQGDDFSRSITIIIIIIIIWSAETPLSKGERMRASIRS